MITVEFNWRLLTSKAKKKNYLYPSFCFIFNTNKIDLSSLIIPGCILAELYTGYPLFPGEDEVEQFSCIMEILGLPPSDLVNASTRKATFFGEFFFINK